MIKNEKHLSVIKDYQDGLSVKEIAVKYKYKYDTTIFEILKKHGISTKNKKWDNEKISVLNNEYPTESWEELLIKLHPFTREEITHKAYKLDIKRENYYFTTQDIAILTENYNKMSVKDLKQIYFPNRTEEAIATKANKLGLISREKWNEDDLNYLIVYYSSITNNELATVLTNRTENSIQSMAYILGIKKTYSKKEYETDFLLKKLIEYSKEIGRTPYLEELHLNPSMPSVSTYYRYFRSYIDACKEAGLEINSNIFGNRFSSYTSDNGDICFSKSELIVTNFLIKNNIKYKKEMLYRDIINDQRCGYKRVDWFIENNTVVEFFGMPEKESYRDKMKEKISICADNNIKLIQLFKNDLIHLNSIFPEYVKSQ